MRRRILVLLCFSLPVRSGTAQQPAHPGHPPPQPAARDTTRARQGPMAHPMAGRLPGGLGIPMTREGSGTAWLPDSSPMHAFHWMAGSWQLMLHGNGFLQYVRESGDRGAEQLGSVNWAMGMARHGLIGGELTVRAMLSAEPWTVGECGYPDLLATGESCNGELLHDRQHPHDLFMELTASYHRELARGLAVQLYGGPVGEPALGPVAYPHRVSAFPNPIAPITHHWLDATHIAFGVVTAGLYGRRWKVEGSLFNGREPDEDRYDFDLGRLDSYSGRLWILPTARWALQGSIGRLEEVEPGRTGGPRLDQTRLTASATHQGSLGKKSGWATTVAWGQNREAEHTTNALLAEAVIHPGERNDFYLRFEAAQKTGDDLVFEGAPELADRIFRVATVGGGYVRRLGRVGGFSPGLGARLAVSVVPRALEPYYGSRSPVGVAVFINLLPARSRGM